MQKSFQRGRGPGIDFKTRTLENNNGGNKNGLHNQKGMNSMCAPQCLHVALQTKIPISAY